MPRKWKHVVYSPLIKTNIIFVTCKVNILMYVIGGHKEPGGSKGAKLHQFL